MDKKIYNIGGKVVETIVPVGATKHAYNTEFGCIVYYDTSNPDVTLKWTGLRWRKWSSVDNVSTNLDEFPYIIPHSNHRFVDVSKYPNNIYLSGNGYKGD